MHKERLERLVQRDGLDRSLAGQVAAGHLSKERALILTRIRQFRKERLDFDAIKLAEKERKPTALDVFGRGWLTGKITQARVYDFDFKPDDGGEPITLHKHDVKAVAPTDVAEKLRGAVSYDDAIKGEGLEGTAERGERVRPSDDTLLTAIEAEKALRFVMRDGEVLQGQVRSFGRWDADLETADGAVVSVLFHGLHPSMSS